MDGGIVLLGLMAVAIFIVGPILGIIAFFSNRAARTSIDRLERELLEMRQRIRSLEGGMAGTIAPAPPIVSDVQPTTVPTAQPAQPPIRSVDDALEAMKGVGRKYSAPPSPYATPVTPSVPSDAPGSEVPQSINESEFAGNEILEVAEVAADAPQVQVPPPMPPISSEASPLSTSPPRPRAPRPTMEMNLGTKWLGWVGGILLIMCAAYFLKYAYENAWIGPKGRLAIGTICGIAAIAFGERFRRRNWQPLFQTLTGIGLATFYICIFFSYQIYKLSAAGPSFGLAILVTGLAVSLAVFHNTISIAILAVLGGFLSPVLLSTGENHPYALFLYVAALDLVAMGAAYFRRWPALELLCFVGTAIMFAGWHQKFGHDPGQLQPALIFVSLFYLMFLLIPTLHTMARGLPDSREGTVLVVMNALFSAMMYYRLLYPAHQHALGFILVGQAVLVFALFKVWVGRVGASNNTSHSLLLVALALVIGAVPLHVSRYGIPIAWGLEGALMAYVGSRYRSTWTRSMGVLALLFGAAGLFYHLPLHTAAFTPVLNVAFGSWLLVAASALGASWVFWKRTLPEDPMRNFLITVTFLLGFGLAWFVLTLEVINYWRWNYVGNYRQANTMASIVVLWSVLSVGAMTILNTRNILAGKWEALTAALFVLTGLAFMASLPDYRGDSTMLILNAAFVPRFVFCVALWWAARVFARAPGNVWKPIMESCGFIALAILLAVEFPRWSQASEVVSQRLAFSFISVAWALEAFVLIWFGLASRQKLRRILGFVLFAVVVLKVLFVDTSELEKVYRIVSFGATGVLLLAAGYFFQKYSAMLQQESDHEETRDA